MKNKFIGSLLVALVIAGTTSFSAFATMPNGTVVIGNKSFDLAYANDTTNITEITNAIIQGGAVYVKDFSGDWIDNTNGLKVNASIVPGEDGAPVIKVTTINSNKTINSLSVGETVAKYKYRLGESYNLFTESDVVSKIKILLGNDYDKFEDCMFSISSDIIYDENNKTYTIKGGMPGLFTIMEGIVQLDENGNIRLAFSGIDNNIHIVKYYTTEKDQASVPMPEEIKNWINDKFPENILIRNDGVKVNTSSISGYYTNTQFKSNNLDISLNDNHIIFVGNATWATHVGYVEGTAEIIDGRYAIYKDESGTLKFNFYDGKLEVEEIGSFGGSNVTFRGTYIKN